MNNNQEDEEEIHKLKMFSALHHSDQHIDRENDHSDASLSRTRSDQRRRNTLFFRTESPGYWTLFLLPLAIYFADQKFLHQSLPSVIIIIYNSVLLFLFHLVGGSRAMKEYVDLVKILNTILAIMGICYGVHLSRNNSNSNLFYEYMLWSGLNFSFPFVFLTIIRHYPRSFSFGEGMIVTSAFVYNYWTSCHNIIESKFSDIQISPDPVIITIFQEMAFLVTILICRGVLLFMQHHKFFPLQEIFTLGSKVAIANFLGKLSSPLADFIFLGHWLFFYLLGDAKHLALLVMWSLFLVITVIFALNTVGETTTIHRKFFHILMCLVYFPAILNDLNFIFLCSTVAFFLFVMIEAGRVLKFEVWGYQIGSMINSGIANFRDARDSGPLLLTPIYLLAGCSSTIWLTGMHVENNSNSNVDRTPEELAAAITGILSVGIGDTVAGVVGSLFGRFHWPGSKKTIEGTIFSILAQIGAVVFLCCSGLLPYTTVSLIALCVSCVVNAVFEALTTQIDNLVIPLVAFNTVHIIVYLSDFVT